MNSLASGVGRGRVALVPVSRAEMRPGFLAGGGSSRGWARIRLTCLMALALAGQMALPMPARAQDSARAADPVQELRLRKLEAEVRALQRQVFPGGDTKFFPQDNAAPPPAPSPMGTPATSAMTDVLTRMDAVEAQIAHLTAQYEELSNHLRQIDARFPPPAPMSGDGAGGVPVPAPSSPPPPAPLVSAPAADATPPAASPPSAKPSAQRVAAVKAVIKPQSGDPGEDDYLYGVKLWEARFYPEAQQQMKLFLGKYPHHQRLSFARNLLGRALLDDGKPREAADIFLQNYKTDPHGARAADSVLYLAAAMVDLKDANRACIALAEFTDNYPADAAGRLKQPYDAIRASVACS